MAWKYTVYQTNNPDPGHTRLKQQLEKILEVIFASPSNNAVKKKLILSKIMDNEIYNKITRVSLDPMIYQTIYVWNTLQAFETP